MSADISNKNHTLDFKSDYLIVNDTSHRLLQLRDATVNKQYMTSVFSIEAKALEAIPWIAASIQQLPSKSLPDVKTDAWDCWEVRGNKETSF